MTDLAPSGDAKRKNRIAPAVNTLAAQDSVPLRVLGCYPAVEKSRQTSDFSVSISRQFQRAGLPRGESLRVSDHAVDAEFQYELTDALASLCRAAEAHRQVRRYIQPFIRPGVSLSWLANEIEEKALQLIGAVPGERGLAFPAGVSLNECAAHYTPNPADAPIKLRDSAVLKVDFGIHVNGYLVDSAFTVAFDERYDNLLLATKEATEVAIRMSGPDACLSDIGAKIEEVISSYEMELNGKMLPLHPIANLSGHMIEPWRIHAGQCVPLVRTNEADRMKANTLYAVETFASTGRGFVESQGECSHYMIDYEFAQRHTVLPRGLVRDAGGHERAQRLYSELLANFRTLAWAPRHLVRMGIKYDNATLQNLVRVGAVHEYPPLLDIPGSLTSQFEHTIYLHDDHTTILTRGFDY